MSNPLERFTPAVPQNPLDSFTPATTPQGKSALDSFVPAAEPQQNGSPILNTLSNVGKFFGSMDATGNPELGKIVNGATTEHLANTFDILAERAKHALDFVAGAARSMNGSVDPSIIPQLQTGVRDVQNLGSKVYQGIENYLSADTGERLKQEGNAVIGLPLTAAKSLFDIGIRIPLEAITGQDLHSKAFSTTPLTAEAHADVIQSTLANVASLAVAGGASKVLGEGVFTGATIELGNGITATEIPAASEVAAAGIGAKPFTALRRAAVGGAAAGATYGAVDEAGKADGHILSSMVASAAIGASFGGAFKLLHNIGNASTRAAGVLNAQELLTNASLSTIPKISPEVASQLEILRQANISENPTAQQAVGVGTELGKNPDNWPLALLKSKINLPNRSILTGVDKETADFARNESAILDAQRYRSGGLDEDNAILGSMAREAVSSGGTFAGLSPEQIRQVVMDNEAAYNKPMVSLDKSNNRTFAFFQRPDGLHDILIGNGETPLSIQQRMAFTKYGHLPGEIVSLNGADYELVRPSSNGNFILRDIVGKEIEAPASNIVRTQNDILSDTHFNDAMWQQFLDDNFREKETTAPKQVPPIETARYKLPINLKNSAPRYGNYIPQFASDFDKAAYMVGKRSGEPNPELVKHITNATGLPLEAIKQHAQVVRSAVKSAALETGRNGGTLDIPPQDFSYRGPRAPISFSEAAPQIEASTQSLAELVSSFAHSNGIADDMIPSMMRDFNARFVNEATNHGLINPEEVKVYNAVAAAAKSAAKAQALGKIDHIGDLDDNLRRNNMYLEPQPGGIYLARDMATGVPIARGMSAEELNSIIKQSRMTKSISLDGGLNASMATPASPDVKPEQSPFNYTQSEPGAIGKFFRGADRLGVIAKAADFYRAIDNKYKTTFLSDVYNNVRNAGEAARSEQLRYDMRLKALQLKYKDLTPTQFQLGVQLGETTSPEDLIKNGYYKDIPYHPDEIELAKQMSQPSVDITKTGRWLLGAKAIQQKLAGADQAMQSALAQWTESFAANPLNNDEQVVAQRVMDASRNPDIHTPAIFRLAYSMQGDGTHPEYSKDLFVKAMAVPPRVQQFAKDMATFHNDLADDFNVQTELNNYFSHKRLLGDNDYFRFDVKGNIVPSDIPFFQLTRTGLVNPYELNPFESIRSYVRAGLRAKYMAPAIDQADKYIGAQQAKLGAEFKSVSDRNTALYNDVQGFPSDDILDINSVVGKQLKKVGLSGDIRQVINLLTSTINANRLGFPSIAAPRDVMNAVMNHWAFFGENNAAKSLVPTSSPTSRFISLLFNSENVDAARRAGLNVDLPMLQLENAGVPGSPTEEFGKGLVGRIERMNQLTYDASGQSQAFGRVVAATYLERVESLSKLVRDWQSHNISEGKFIEQSRLRRYDQATIDQFNKLIAGQQNEQAIDYLAKETVKHLNMDFGSGANPQGWTSAVGRIFGMNGQWTVGQRSFLTRGLTNGTTWDKLGFAYRNVAANTMLNAAGKAVGMNMAAWLTVPTSIGALAALPRSPLYSTVTEGKKTENLVPWAANMDRIYHGFLDFSNGQPVGALQKFMGIPSATPQ